MSLPPGFFDSKPGADVSSSSLSGREHAVEGFFDAPKPVSNKRSREEEEHERRVREREAEEEDEMEEAEEEEEEEEEDRAAALDRMLDEAVEVEAMDLHQLKRNLLALERKVMKNQEMRVRHADEPSRFMDSEIELFEEVNKLQVLATCPELYPEFVKLQGVQKVTELMDHENVDVALSAVELIHELTDPDSLSEGDEQGIKSLVDGLIESAALEQLVRFLGRLDEAEDDQKQGVYNIMSIIENLSELQPLSLEAVCEKTELIDWLLKRLKVKAFDANKLYASEVLSIICQSSEVNQKRVGAKEGIDRLLQLVAPWKKKDPPGEEESEMVQNIFNVLCSALMVTDNQVALVEGEGIELMVIVMQNRRFAARCALKVLDYAMARNTAACQHFVQAMGLKSIFPAFMKSSVICLTRPKEAKLSAKEDDEHVVSIISSLLLRLSGESHARLLAKFVENDFEKVDRLVEMHGKYHKAVQEAGDGDEDEDEDEDEEDDGLAVEERRYIARLEKGLFILQQIAVIISFLLTEEVAGLEDRIRMILRQTGGDLKQVLDTLQEYEQNVGDADAAKSAQSDFVDMKEVVGDLAAVMRDIVAGK